MNKKGIQLYSRESLENSALLWLYAGILALMFLNPWGRGFYFAGNVSDNLKHFQDNSVCLASGNALYSGGFTGCVAKRRHISADTVVFEYPPLAAGLLWFLGKLSLNESLYPQAFTWLMVILFCLCFHGALGEALAMKRAGGPDRRLAVTAVCIAAAAACGPVGLVSFDILPGLLSLLAVAALSRGRAVRAGVLLGLSVAMKGYAIVLLPLFVFAWLWRGRRALTGGMAGFMAAPVASVAAGMMYSPQEFIRSFTYHAGRGLELNSVYAAALVYFKAPGLKQVFDHGSWNLSPGPATDFLSRISPLLMLGAIALVTAAFWLRGAKMKHPVPHGGPGMDKSISADIPMEVFFARWTVAVLIAFMLTFKVGSPQFFCWVAPLVPLLALGRGWAWIAPVLLFTAAGHAATFVFPWHWQSYAANLNPLPAAALLIEKACLLGACVFVIPWKKS